MHNNIQTKKEARRMDLGWWGPAAILIALTIAEWVGAFALISKVSAFTTSWQWTPTSSSDLVGR
jgi:hypothetical protein